MNDQVYLKMNITCRSKRYKDLKFNYSVLCHGYYYSAFNKFKNYIMKEIGTSIDRFPNKNDIETSVIFEPLSYAQCYAILLNAEISGENIHRCNLEEIRDCDLDHTDKNIGDNCRIGEVSTEIIKNLIELVDQIKNRRVLDKAQGRFEL